MEEIVEKILEAERAASERKAQAQAEAETSVNAAHARAAELLRDNEISCKKLREEGILAAKRQAEEAYSSAVSACRERAHADADSLLAAAERYVTDIVRRIAK